MKTAVLILCALAVAGCVSAQDVRNVSWGMTQAEVIEREGKDYLVMIPLTITYRRVLLGKNVTVYFAFQEERLVGLLYHPLEGSDVYDRIKKSLREKYGAPTENAFLSCTWVGPRTTIHLTNELTSADLYYGDTKWAQAKAEQQTQEDADEL